MRTRLDLEQLEARATPTTPWVSGFGVIVNAPDTPPAAPISGPVASNGQPFDYAPTFAPPSLTLLPNQDVGGAGSIDPATFNLNTGAPSVDVNSFANAVGSMQQADQSAPSTSLPAAAVASPAPPASAAAVDAVFSSGEFSLYLLATGQR